MGFAYDFRELRRLAGAKRAPYLSDALDEMHLDVLAKGKGALREGKG